MSISPIGAFGFRKRTKRGEVVLSLFSVVKMEILIQNHKTFRRITSRII